MEDFPDRREQLFGREDDIGYLLARAPHSGLTAVVGRPLMGKTWSLLESARRLSEDQYLVGYHEATGGEASHLLYAFSNLYVRWLADATLLDQALSLWEHQRSGLIPRVAQMAGAIFEKLGAAVVPGAVAGIVRAGFDALVQLQQDLTSGGLQLPPLPYEQALSLQKLVTRSSGRRIVLILDAWEKSLPGSRMDATILEAIIKHADIWDRTHVFLGLRSQDVDSTRMNDDALRRARDLCRLSRRAEIYALPLMDQTDQHERERMLNFARQWVPSIRDQPDKDILAAIEGYPGVLNFWTNDTCNLVERTWEHFVDAARNAHALRYIELDHLLDSLTDASRAFAARIAFFPRMDPERWSLLRDILLQEHSAGLVETLADEGVLADESYPTFGHDTRHIAARRWFIEHWRPLMRRTAEACICNIASRITGTTAENRGLCEALIACSETARSIGIDPRLDCLLDAAQAFFGTNEALFRTDFDELSSAALQRDPRFTPLVARALSNRGFTKLQREDYDGAIVDFTRVIELAGAPAEDVAEALYNRAHIKGLRSDTLGAIHDYTSAIELPHMRVQIVSKALCNRGLQKTRCGDILGAIADYTAVLEEPDVPSEEVAQALINRGARRLACGDLESAIADFTSAIQTQEIPIDLLAGALYNRALTRDQMGDRAGAFSDYTSVIQLPGVSVENKTRSLCNRGVLKEQMQGRIAAITEYTSVIECPAVPTDELSLALVNRGLNLGLLGNEAAAVADYTATIALVDAPDEHKAIAHYHRGLSERDTGNDDRAMTDFTSAIRLSKSSVEYSTRALLERARMRLERKDVPGASIDFTAIIETRNVSAELLSLAHGGRGIGKFNEADHAGAFSDFTSAIECPGAPADVVARALTHRAVLKDLQGDEIGAMADFESASSLPGTSFEVIEYVRSIFDQLREG